LSFTYAKIENVHFFKKVEYVGCVCWSCVFTAESVGPAYEKITGDARSQFGSLVGIRHIWDCRPLIRAYYAVSTRQSYHHRHIRGRRGEGKEVGVGRVGRRRGWSEAMPPVGATRIQSIRRLSGRSLAVRLSLLPAVFMCLSACLSVDVWVTVTFYTRGSIRSWLTHRSRPTL